MNLSTKQKHIHRHREQSCGCQGGWGKDKDGLGAWGQQMQTMTFRMDKQQVPTVQYREPCPISWDEPQGEKYRKRRPVCA